VVIGIGMNIHMPETNNIDQAWVSLHHILPHITDRNYVVSQLLNTLDKYLANFMQLNFADFIHTWQYWDLLKQHDVHAQYANKSLYGQVIGINSHGALQLQPVNGTAQTLYAAEVSIRKKP
jgi:BirA family biotin operon repressor/biotin-[acetyl-CoA-carboxylase] ligase